MHKFLWQMHVSEDGLKCHLKQRKQFFEENMDLSKNLCAVLPV